MDACLNCGAALTGKFCASCGQRVIPPYPSIRELAGDAWHELSGYDGRFARTIRALFGKPGALTRDVLEGKRARYVSPVRLYLVASLIYFVTGAASPNLRVEDPSSGEMREFKIGVWTSDDETPLSPEDRAEVERIIAKSHWLVKPLFESAAHEPDALQSRMVMAMPKVLFALVPVFAGILALFCWKRPYSQHFVLALHLHTVIFLALAVAELPKFSGNVPISVTVAMTALLFIVVYALRGFRHMYGSGWSPTLLKAAGIGVVYAAVSIPTMFAVIVAIAFVGRS